MTTMHARLFIQRNCCRRSRGRHACPCCFMQLAMHVLLLQLPARVRFKRSSACYFDSILLFLKTIHCTVPVSLREMIMLQMIHRSKKHAITFRVLRVA